MNLVHSQSSPGIMRYADVRYAFHIRKAHAQSASAYATKLFPDERSSQVVSRRAVHHQLDCSLGLRSQGVQVSTANLALCLVPHARCSCSNTGCSVRRVGSATHCASCTCRYEGVTDHVLGGWTEACFVYLRLCNLRLSDDKE